MTISPTERHLRIRASQSALASVRLAGLEPSPQVEALFAAWAEDRESLDTIRQSLMEQLEDAND